LIPLLEAESLWQAADSARALVSALGDWELEAAWRHLGDIELACCPWNVAKTAGAPFQERLGCVTAALRSVSADLLAPAELNLHN